MKIEPKTTLQFVQQIVDESRAVGQEVAVLWHGDTAIVVVQNPARMVPRGPDMVPGFYAAKIHAGRLVSEHFI